MASRAVLPTLSVTPVEPHLDHPVEPFGKTPIDRKALNHRIRERPAGGCLQFIFLQIPFDGVDIDRPEALYFQF